MRWTSRAATPAAILLCAAVASAQDGLEDDDGLIHLNPVYAPSTTEIALSIVLLFLTLLPLLLCFIAWRACEQRHYSNARVVAWWAFVAGLVPCAGASFFALAGGGGWWTGFESVLATLTGSGTGTILDEALAPVLWGVVFGVPALVASRALLARAERGVRIQEQAREERAARVEDHLAARRTGRAGKQPSQGTRLDP